MRTKYKGFLLAADYSLQDKGKIVAGIYKLPDYQSVKEVETNEGSLTDMITLLKKEVNESIIQLSAKVLTMS